MRSSEANEDSGCRVPLVSSMDPTPCFANSIIDNPAEKHQNDRVRTNNRTVGNINLKNTLNKYCNTVNLFEDKNLV